MLANGLFSGPQKSAQLTKLPIACLRIKRYMAIYVDDIIVIRETYEECLIGTIKTINCF